MVVFPRKPLRLSPFFCPPGLEAISAVEKSRHTEKRKGLVGGRGTVVASNQMLSPLLGGESVSIDRRVPRMEINLRGRLATLSHLCKSGHRLIDEIFKSSEALNVHSNDNDNRASSSFYKRWQRVPLLLPLGLLPFLYIVILVRPFLPVVRFFLRPSPARHIETDFQIRRR